MNAAAVMWLAEAAAGGPGAVMWLAVATAGGLGPGMWLAIAAAGGLGAVARFLVDLGVVYLDTGRSRPAADAAGEGSSRRNISPSASRASVADHGTPSRRVRRPWVATMVVNVTGSLLAGLAAGSAVAGHLGVEVETVVAGGFLGAYTTFSTAMFQAMAVFEERRSITALTYLITTLVLAVGAAWCGMTITT